MAKRTAKAPSLRTGQKVMWSGAFGAESPIEAKVTGIEITHGNGDKNGKSVVQVPWSKVKGIGVIVTLNNGKWAWGSQISPMPKKEKLSSDDKRVAQEIKETFGR